MAADDRRRRRADDLRRSLRRRLRTMNERQKRNLQLTVISCKQIRGGGQSEKGSLTVARLNLKLATLHGSSERGLILGPRSISVYFLQPQWPQNRNSRGKTHTILQREPSQTKKRGIRNRVTISYYLSFGLDQERHVSE